MDAEQGSIVLDPNVLAGKPVIRGTRLSVEFVIGLLADGWSEADILANYPGIKREDILACLAYARETLRSERVFPSAA
jgi:uncharacterized protein (DUF433 family)